MKKYRVSVVYYVTHTIEIEAKNKKEALKIAYDAQPSACVSCSKELEIESVVDPIVPTIELIEE